MRKIAILFDSIGDDGNKLFRDSGIRARNLVELGGLAKQADPDSEFSRSIVALLRVVEKYTGKALDKGRVRTSNWEAVPLTEDQLVCTCFTACPYYFNCF